MYEFKLETSVRPEACAIYSILRGGSLHKSRGVHKSRRESRRELRRLSGAQVLSLLGNSTFVDEFTDFLNTYTLAFFMVWVPLPTPLPFYFSLQPTVQFMWQTPSVRRYDEYLTQCGSVMEFTSLSGNHLVVPCPHDAEYGHMQQFLARAPRAQIRALFARVQAFIGKRPVYVSTHGLDVPWLHVRLEGKPSARNALVLETMQRLQASVK
jgi:hypothetical protein